MYNIFTNHLFIIRFKYQIKLTERTKERKEEEAEEEEEEAKEKNTIQKTKEIYMVFRLFFVYNFRCV